jgi:hypothetical protein
MSLKKIFFYLTILLSIVSFGKIASAADFPDRPISVMVAL